MDRNRIINHTLIGLFCVLYISVGFVSTYHAVSFFALSNVIWLAVILAITFEVGQAVVLFSLLIQQKRKVMPWILMSVLTCVQVLGNVFASYKYMVLNNADQIKYFTDSILFFIKNPNPQVNNVMISYITGAILPIVSLCMTAMVVSLIEKREEKTAEEPVVENKPEEKLGPVEEIFI